MHPSRGFTLLELMVVVALLGGVLLLVPANLGAFGARSRLDSAGNSLTSVLTGAREQAISDGYEVRVEIGGYKDSEGTHQGYRYLFTSLPPAQAGIPEEDEDKARELREMRGKERQWLSTTWKPLGDGIKFVGFSDESRRWEGPREGQAFRVSFNAEGNVDRAFALRIESQDMDVPKEKRTLTVLVNGLTAEATVVDGFKELPEKKDAREIQ
jgi:prepilin-type N-terminal cleavage/methylation domain-containing protein